MLLQTASDIALLVAAGATGGVLYGLIHHQPYTVCLPGRERRVNVGFLGDVLVGCSSSVGIFVLAGNLLNLAWESVPEDTGETLKVLALGVVAGFTGLTLLHQLSSSVLSMARVKDEIKDLRRSDSAQQLAGEGNRYLFEKQYVLALEAFDRSLKLEPDAIDTLLNLAKTLKRLQRYPAALSVTERVLKLDPKNARAFYNRACYRCLVDPVDKNMILEDLKRAAALNAEYLAIARTDEDFEAIAESEEFRALTGVAT